MEKKKIMMIVACVFLIVISSNMIIVESASDPACYDSCNMGCINSNTRLYLRCDRKCQIRCGPDSKADEHHG